ncbi:hypothetical protein [Streptomyces sp. YS-3]|uniref:hypothetical protein n=1 Tax=Streptomyces sp. YS-3 TaxID=3381352 RepID=UPI003862D16B
MPVFAIIPGTGRGSRIRIALYACVPAGCDPDAALGALRAYATSRQWTVTAALYDVGPLDRPKDRRPGLTRVLRLMEDGRIGGLVAPSAAHLAVALPLRSRAAGGFISYAEVVTP